MLSISGEDLLGLLKCGSYQFGVGDPWSFNFPILLERRMSGVLNLGQKSLELQNVGLDDRQSPRKSVQPASGSPSVMSTWDQRIYCDAVVLGASMPAFGG